jgi:hypothetical protein
MKRMVWTGLLSCAFLTASMHAATPLHDGWKLQSSCNINAGGKAISTPDFAAAGWLATSVPNTVVAAQVGAHVLPDPYFADNLRKLPGMTYPVAKNFSNLPMAADSPYHCSWWYRKEFTAPAAAKDGHYWLHFGGINYRANIWVNGQQIADRSPAPTASTIWMSRMPSNRARPTPSQLRSLRPPNTISASTGSTGIRRLPIKTWDCGATSACPRPAPWH